MFNRDGKHSLHGGRMMDPSQHIRLQGTVETGESKPKMVKVTLSANRIIVRVFWDTHSTIHINYVGKLKTIRC